MKISKISSSRLFLVATASCLLIVGCTVSSPIVPLNSPVVVQQPIRVGFPSQADTSDVPSLMAIEMLRGQGVSIEPIFFGTPDLAVAALASGGSDISNGSTRTHWAAVEQGGKLAMIMEQAANPWTLVSRPELETCQDLDGKRIAVNSPGSVSTALLNAYVVLNCPEAKPETLFITGSDNRAAAMEANQADGALLEIADVLALENKSPGRYKSLINYAEALPKLKTNGIYVAQSFGSQHADVVRDYLRAVLTVHRQIRENPQLLVDALVKYLKFDTATAEQVANAYLERETWNVNGGMDTEDVQYTIDFFVETGGLPTPIAASEVSDLSYLKAVLEDLGTN